HTRFSRDWSSDVCSSDLNIEEETWGAIRKKVEEAQKPPQDPDDDGDENGSGDEVHDKKNLRTCTVSLNQILRPDLEVNGRKVFEIGRASCRERVQCEVAH